MTCDNSGAMRLLGNLPSRVRLIEADFLAKVGDRFCEVARETKTYNDVTGCLSASIGYGVAVDGRLVKVGGFGGGEGENEGLAALHRAVSELSTDSPTLIVVAGMRYALYVERSGHVVLDGVRFRMDEIVSSLINEMQL